MYMHHAGLFNLCIWFESKYQNLAEFETWNKELKIEKKEIEMNKRKRSFALLAAFLSPRPTHLLSRAAHHQGHVTHLHSRSTVGHR